MTAETFGEFMRAFDPAGTRTVTEIRPVRDADGNSPFVVVRHGRFTAVLALMPFDDHLCIDVHPFADDRAATAGVFGMSAGRTWRLPVTGALSHGWPSASLISVLTGRQEGTRTGG